MPGNEVNCVSRTKSSQLRGVHYPLVHIYLAYKSIWLSRVDGGVALHMPADTTWTYGRMSISTLCYTCEDREKRRIYIWRSGNQTRPVGCQPRHVVRHSEIIYPFTLRAVHYSRLAHKHLGDIIKTLTHFDLIWRAERLRVGGRMQRKWFWWKLLSNSWRSANEKVSTGSEVGIEMLRSPYANGWFRRTYKIYGTETLQSRSALNLCYSMLTTHNKCVGTV